MKFEELKLWIADTIGEGGYSFKELYEYLRHHDIEEKDSLAAIKSLKQNRMIEISICQSGEKLEKLDICEENNALERFSEIVRVESKTQSSHYFNITDLGLEYLQENGIRYDDR